MLEADWEACERGYYAGELRIQEKELRLYTKCNAIIAKHAAFFALIAYSALSMTPHWLDEALTSHRRATDEPHTGKLHDKPPTSRHTLRRRASNENLRDRLATVIRHIPENTNK